MRKKTLRALITSKDPNLDRVSSKRTSLKLDFAPAEVLCCGRPAFGARRFNFPPSTGSFT